MTLDPPRRTYQDAPAKKGPRDVDTAAGVRRMKTLAFALYGGLPLGGAAGFAAGHPFWGLLLGPVLIWAVTIVVAGLAGQGVAFLYLPSGSSAPRRKEYSRAESLEARGEYEAAILAFQAAIVDAPKDGEPYLRIARIYRDGIKKPEEALRWFRRGLSEAEFSRSQEILTRREAAELLIHHLGEPARAAPDLARLAETYAGTPAGIWALEELARIKGEMAGGGP